MAAQSSTADESLRYSQVVGDTFVEQYYHYLLHYPDMVHRFYQESSRLGRPNEQGNVTSVTTIDAINEKILSADSSIPEIKTVHCQDSLNGGVVVLVTGYLNGEDNVKKEFIQSFFLAPQEKGYFVLNDVLMHVGKVDHKPGQQGFSNDEVDAKAIGVCNPLSDGESMTLQEELDSGLIDEVSDCYQSMTVKSKDTSAHGEMAKKSYASVVKAMKDNASISAPAQFPPREASAKTEQHSVPAFLASYGPTSNSSAAESNNFQKTESNADGHSIYVKNLPLDATLVQLEEEFKRFGSIKPGGIQVKGHKLQNSCFGFVEFKLAGAVRSAIEASPIIIAGRRVYIEEKRMVGSGVNNRGRFAPSKGGDGVRERSSYGGWRSYGS